MKVPVPNNIPYQHLCARILINLWVWPLINLVILEEPSYKWPSLSRVVITVRQTILDSNTGHLVLDMPRWSIINISFSSAPIHYIQVFNTFSCPKTFLKLFKKHQSQLQTPNATPQFISSLKCHLNTYYCNSLIKLVFQKVMTFWKKFL